MFYLLMFGSAVASITLIFWLGYEEQKRIDETNRKLEQMLLQYANLNDVD